MPWYVLITRPKSEKKVARALIEKRIEAYCPISTEIRQWSDRKKKVELPLLPSMILVNVHEAERVKVFEVSGAVRYLFWLGEPATVSDAEIEVLKDINKSEFKVLDIGHLKPGEEINLDRHGFEFEKGTIKYLSGNQCWVVLHNLGYVIKLQIG